MTLKVDPDTVFAHDGRFELVVLVVDARVVAEVVFAVADEVVRAVVEAVEEAARLPLATGAVAC
ncbi:MAG: hypothetical protein ACOH16_02120 [Propionibacteriaceae bacterium]